MKITTIRTANLMRSSPTLPSSNNNTSFSASTSRGSNAELINALTYSFLNPDDKMDSLQDERSEYDITAKLFFVPDNAHDAAMTTTTSSESSTVVPVTYIHDAVGEVCAALSCDSVDLLILSFPNIVLDADDTDTFDAPELERIATTYRAAASLLQDRERNNDNNGEGAGGDVSRKGTVKALGVAEFSATRLRQLCDALGSVPAPEVNQINLKDCCVTPRDLIVYAKERGIKLFTHGDPSDILPTEQARELLSSSSSRGYGNGVTRTNGTEGASRGAFDRRASAEVDEAGSIETRDNRPQQSSTARPLWVVKYTAVASKRGVVENKGYIVTLEEDED